MWRQVIGKVYRTDDTPWTNTTVTFRRCTGSYTTTTQYPPDTLRFQTNSNGELVDCKLWVNETGDKISIYECNVGKDKFKFSLPTGNGSPIELSVLRAGSLPVDEYPQSIIDYIDNSVASVSSNKYESFNAIPQTNSYQLTSLPISPNTSKVYFNGLKQKYGIDYVINTSNLNILKNVPTNYLLEIYYG